MIFVALLEPKIGQKWQILPIFGDFEGKIFMFLGQVYLFEEVKAS